MHDEARMLGQPRLHRRMFVRGVVVGDQVQCLVLRGLAVDLAQEFQPLGMRVPLARQLASDIDVSPSRISELVNGQRPVTADTALRLGLFFGMEPRFWLNLQSEYDIRVADRELRAKLAPRIRVFQPMAG